MKGKLIEYDESGKLKSSKSVDVGFASSDEHPCIYIQLPDIHFRHRAIHVSAKALLALILGRMIDKLRY